MIFRVHGTSEANPDIYSVVEDGTVVYVYKDASGNGGSPKLGNQVQIKDEKTGNFYRFCHLLEGSISVNVGDKVNLSTKLRKNAETQEILAGTHLHLELSTSQAWICDNFLNPVEPLGIPNVQGTIVKYNGEKPPNPPISRETNNWKKWLQTKMKKINIFT